MVREIFCIVWPRGASESQGTPNISTIRMKTRVPVNSGNTGWDTTFDGRLSKASVANFVLYHDSSVRKDLCIFGKLRDNEYELEVGYPLSPLQGFLAGVTAMLPL